ncbi:MAG: hypothetical protein U0836_21290 [Pirellulales bacterium]
MPIAVSNPIFVDVDGDDFRPDGDLLDTRAAGARPATALAATEELEFSLLPQAPTRRDDRPAGNRGIERCQEKFAFCTPRRDVHGFVEAVLGKLLEFALQSNHRCAALRC